MQVIRCCTVGFVLPWMRCDCCTCDGCSPRAVGAAVSIRGAAPPDLCPGCTRTPRLPLRPFAGVGAISLNLRGI